MRIYSPTRRCWIEVNPIQTTDFMDAAYAYANLTPAEMREYEARQYMEAQRQMNPNPAPTPIGSRFD